MKKLAAFTMLFLWFCLWSHPAYATEWYCTSTAQGSKDGTSWDNAWACTGASNAVVWGGSGVVAGDTLYIDGGSSGITYTATGNNMFTVGASGSDADHRITIATGAKSPSSSGHDGTVTFDGDGAYAVLINCNSQQWVKFDGEKNGAINWIVQDTKRTGAYSSANYAVGLTNAMSSTGKIFTYIRVHDASDGINAGAVTDGTSVLEISYCDIHDVVGDHLISVSGTAAQTLGNILIHHNTLQNLVDSSASNAGPDVLQGTFGIDFYNNTVTSIAGTTIHTQHPDFVQINFDKCRLYNNVLDGSGVNGIQTLFPNFSSGDRPDDITFKFYNNLIKRVNGAGSVVSGGGVSTTLIMANNTWADNAYSTTQYAISLNFSAADSSLDVTVDNNIIYNSGWGSNIQAVFVRLNNVGQLSGITFSNNALNAGGHGSTLVHYYVDSNQNLTQTNSQTGAPTFTTYTEYAASNDYHLSQSDTAAKDNGLDLSSALSTTTDITGATRSGPWDIGAYEYTVNGDPTSPEITLGSGGSMSFGSGGSMVLQ